MHVRSTVYFIAYFAKNSQNRAFVTSQPPTTSAPLFPSHCQLLHPHLGRQRRGKPQAATLYFDQRAGLSLGFFHPRTLRQQFVQLLLKLRADGRLQVAQVRSLWIGEPLRNEKRASASNFSQLQFFLTIAANIPRGRFRHCTDGSRSSRATTALCGRKQDAMCYEFFPSPFLSCPHLMVFLSAARGNAAAVPIVMHNQQHHHAAGDWNITVSFQFIGNPNSPVQLRRDVGPGAAANGHTQPWAIRHHRLEAQDICYN